MHTVCFDESTFISLGLRSQCGWRVLFGRRFFPNRTHVFWLVCGWCEDQRTKTMKTHVYERLDCIFRFLSTTPHLIMMITSGGLMYSIRRDQQQTCTSNHRKWINGGPILLQLCTNYFQGTTKLRMYYTPIGAACFYEFTFISLSSRRWYGWRVLFGRHLYFGWYVGEVRIKEQTPWRHVFITDWTASSYVY